MKASTIVHLDPATLNVAGLLRCDHPDGRVSFRLVDGETQVWVTGTVDDFLRFAADMGGLADRVSLEPIQFRSPDQDATA